MSQAFEPTFSEPKLHVYHVRLLGTGAAAPTKVLGTGITVTRTAEGRYLLTWAENPYVFAGLTWGLQGTTQGNVKGHTVTCGAYPQTASTYTLEVDLWDSTFAAEDLEDAEWMTLDIAFKRTGI